MINNIFCKEDFRKMFLASLLGAGMCGLFLIHEYIIIFFLVLIVLVGCYAGYKAYLDKDVQEVSGVKEFINAMLPKQK
jgi:hypothetical protein